MEKTLRKTAKEYPVVTLTGPRQSGKTTLVKNTFPEYAYVNLELPENRVLAREDPRSFFLMNKPPVIIDEIQRVPVLLSYIQIQVDEQRDFKGRFILTGSHQLTLRAELSQSLAGRTALLNLLPLSLGELSTAGNSADRDSVLFRGCMPQIYQEDIDPTGFYRNYYQTYVERDILQLIHLRHAVAFENFMKLLAGRTGQVVNLSDLSNTLGISVPTLTEWLSILEASFILFRLQPYFGNFGKRIIKKPKIFFTDPGLASYLLGITKPEEIAVGPFLGNLFENLVILEIMKTRLNLGQDPNLYFFRENNGIETDLLLTGFQKFFPVEIKASRTFSPDFCMNLQKIQKLHKNMEPGAVVYAGEQEMEFKKVKIVNFRNAGSLAEESFS